MNESIAMKEIRKIRDENSLRHMNMSFEERKKEGEEAVAWLSRKLGKPIKTVKA